MSYFATPFVFDQVMSYLGEIDNTGLGPYQYTYIVVPTGPSTFTTPNFTWLDTRTQPTWAYITTGTGWTTYNNYYQTSVPVFGGEADTALAAVTALIPIPSQSKVTRTLNSAFQVSSTRNSMVNYTNTISAALSLTGGQTGTVSLQICSTSGGTYVEIANTSNGNTGTLTLGLGITQGLNAQVFGFVPAGYYIKLVTSGTAAISYVTGQETLM